MASTSHQLLRKNYKSKLKLICLDTSENSIVALKWYLKNVHQEDDHIGLIHIHSDPHLPIFGLYKSGDHGIMVTDHMREASINKSFADSLHAITKAEDICKSHKVFPKVFVEHANGHIGHKICKIAEEHCSLIIMGQRGENPSPHHNGSTVAHVKHHSSVPLTVVPNEVYNP